MEFVDKLRAFLEFDVWGYLMKKYSVTYALKLKIFSISSLAISFILEIIIMINSAQIPEAIASFSLTIATVLWIVGININSKSFNEIKQIYLWEIVIGALIIISAFTLVTPIKHIFYPETRNFGILNGGVVIFGVFIIFYGIRNVKVVFPYGFLYGAFMFLNLLWNTLGYSFLGSYLALVSSKEAYNILSALGYPVSISNTTITIISRHGNPISATISGLCSGIEGITFSILIMILLFMGSNIRYKWRVISIIIASFLMFIINILRIVLIFITAYYYEYEGLTKAHAWLGDILFIAFVIPYWYIIDRKLNIISDGDEKLIKSS